jgi:hypothetical protein
MNSRYEDHGRLRDRRGRSYGPCSPLSGSRAALAGQPKNQFTVVVMVLP